MEYTSRTAATLAATYIERRLTLGHCRSAEVGKNPGFVALMRSTHFSFRLSILMRTMELGSQLTEAMLVVQL